MDKFKKILRRSFIILLIILAGAGIGLAGGAAILPKAKEDSDKDEALIEMVELKEVDDSIDGQMLEIF